MIDRITDDFGVFVDKTRYLALLFIYHISLSHQCLFIRPRRFGKSTILRLIEELCKKNPDILFAGTELIKEKCELVKIKGEFYKNKEFLAAWEIFTESSPIPCFLFDFSSIAHCSLDDMKKGLRQIIMDNAEQYEITLNKENTTNLLLQELFKEAYIKYKLVFVLVDECDSPIMASERDDIRKLKVEILLDFFTIMKISRLYIQFAFITGITKSNLFDHPSCSHIEDISLDPMFANMCGYTKEEVEKYVFPKDQRGSYLQGKTEEEFALALEENYPGICFDSDSKEKLYNPWSVLLCRQKRGNIEPYWADSIERSIAQKQFVEQYPDFLLKRSTVIVHRAGLRDDGTSNWQKDDIARLLWMQGLLTIEKRMDLCYILKPSNMEVRTFWAKLIVKLRYKFDFSSVVASELREAFVTCAIDKIESLLNKRQSKSSHFPFKSEESFRTFVQDMLFLAGIVPFQNQTTAGGAQTEIIAKYQKLTYVIKLKYKHTAAEVLQQIVDNQDSLSIWATNDRPATIIELGLNYGSTKALDKRVTAAANSVTTEEKKTKRELIYPKQLC